jgi:hypothetical protein
MMCGMTSRDIRELLELSERLHRDTRRACERSRATCDSVLTALSEFNRDVGLTEADLDAARRHRAGEFTAPRFRDLPPL